MIRKVLNINDSMKTFESDGMPITRAFLVWPHYKIRNH